MKTKKIVTSIAMAMTIGMFYTSCEKVKDSITDTDVSSAQDNSTADGAISNIFKSVSEAADTTSGAKAGGCPVITMNKIVGWPRTLTINFGNIGCNSKKGKIVAVMSGPFRTPGSTITVTTVNYSDGTDTIDVGTHIITNKGNNLAGNQYFSVDVTGAVIKSPSGTVTWNTNRTLEWAAGSSTPTDPTDDVYLIGGTASGTSTKGVSFTAAIGTPLKIVMGCPYIESGTITLTPSGKAARTFDFGTTGCDDDATVTISGVTTKIKL